MTQILKPTDAMIEKVARAICWAMAEEEDDCSSTCLNAHKCMADEVQDCFRRDALAAITAMSRHSDPDELREALERARKHVEFVTRAHAYISADLIDARETLAIIDTALSRNVGDVG